MWDSFTVKVILPVFISKLFLEVNNISRVRRKQEPNIPTNLFKFIPKHPLTFPVNKFLDLKMLVKYLVSGCEILTKNLDFLYTHRFLK